jgi:hypothetical protein
MEGGGVLGLARWRHGLGGKCVRARGGLGFPAADKGDGIFVITDFGGKYLNITVFECCNIIMIFFTSIY